MNVEQLKLLLQQDEGPTLEFKREWYKIDAEGEAKNRNKGELVKDILALANGNAYSAGEIAYLVIGVNNEFNVDGCRELTDVGNNVPNSATILSIVRAYSDPPLENVEVVPYTIDGKRIFVIIIPPTPHLYETTRKIDTPTQSYSQHVVFIRRSETVDIASAKEREVIHRLKVIRFSETKNVPPALFGAGIGATVGSIMLAPMGEKLTEKKEGYFAGLIIGLGAGGFLGGIIGNTYKDLREIKANWYRIPLWGKAAGIGFGTVWCGVLFALMKRRVGAEKNNGS